MLENPHRKALLRKAADGNEHLIALQNDKVIKETTSGRKRSVDIPQSLWKTVCKADANIILMHNHPSEATPFSFEDVWVFYQAQGVTEMTAEAQKASFSIQRTEITKNLKHSFKDFGTYGKNLDKHLLPDVDAGQIGADMATSAIMHAVMQSMHKRGFVNYRYAGDMSEREKIIADTLRSAS